MEWAGVTLHPPSRPPAKLVSEVIHAELACILALVGRQLLSEIQAAFSKLEEDMKGEKDVQGQGCGDFTGSTVTHQEELRTVRL